MTDPAAPSVFGDHYIQPKTYSAMAARINRDRIEHRKNPSGGGDLSYVSQADIRRALIIMFGFARWSEEVLETEIIYEIPTLIGPKTDKQGNALEQKPGWEITIRSKVRLTVCSPDGTHLATYTEEAAASNTMGNKGSAYEQALKSASSDALKRCAINLGDQFGLGLYRKQNQDSAFIRASFVTPFPNPAEAPQAEPLPSVEHGGDEVAVAVDEDAAPEPDDTDGAVIGAAVPDAPFDDSNRGAVDAQDFTRPPHDSYIPPTPGTPEQIRHALGGK